MSPEESFNFWSNSLTSRSANLPSLYSDIIERSTHLHHPGYIGHQVAAGHPVNLLADLIAGVLDNGMAVYEMGQASVPMEKAVCSVITDTIHWGDLATGFFTSGGTLANLTALLTARQVHSDNKYWEKGHDYSQYAVMVSSEAHYCVDRAVKIMGLGKDGIIHIPVDKNFKVITGSLEEIYQKQVSAGIEVFAFVANAGSTGTGSYDDLLSIHEFCKKHGIWMHVDGAHGAGVIFSEKYDYLINGLEFADSLTLDFHKLLQASILCTALLYRNGKDSYHTFSQGAKYLYEDQTEEWYQLGKRTFECTKPMMIIKAFTLLQQLGIPELGKAIDYRYDLAKQFAKLIEYEKDLELAVTPESNIVVFRILFELPISECNELNHKIRIALNTSGEFYLVQTQIQDKVFLRCSLMNPATTIEILKNLITRIKEFKIIYLSK